MTTLLEAHQVSKIFSSGGGFFGRNKRQTIALNRASLVIPADQPTVISIAGESGSGKTTLSRLLLGLIQPTQGEICYQGYPITQMEENLYLQYRQEVQAIFQDPFAVYNPFYKVDHALSMPIQSFRPELTKAEADKLIDTALKNVGLRPEETLGRYAHQLSGGQRQRIMVARALLLDPRVIIADEPVSMVDASLRATILESLLEAHRQLGISLIYITHDLTTAYQVSQHILMLYQGSTVEVGDVDLVIKSPMHPYTQLLVGSIPLPNPKRRWGANVLEVEQTQTNNKSGQSLQGCRFANRCPQVMDICHQSQPPLYATDKGRGVACYLYQDAPTMTDDDVLKLYSNEEVIAQAK